MSATEELKPCPFCGGEAEIVGDDYMEWIAECVECCASSMTYATEAEAVEAWNTRAATTIGKVQVEVEPVLHGTLTAEQVRELIAPHLHARPTFDFGRHGAVWSADFKAIADELNAALGGNENRISERLRGVASDMRNIGASSMTPHELFAYWAREVDKAADLAATIGGGECELVEVDSYSNAGEVIHVLECSACGRTCEHVNGSYPRCPHCGRKAKR